MAPSAGSKAVDEYLASVPTALRAPLDAVRESLRSVLPHGEECLKYGMPAVALDGKGIAGYAPAKDHWSYFPMSGSVLEAAGDAVARYPTSKGGLRLGYDERLPKALLRRLVKLRLAELGAVTSGKRTEYFDDGRLKAAGPMRDGLLHGRWSWYRRDGTLLRTGAFTRGEKTGTWVTYDRDGQPLAPTSY